MNEQGLANLREEIENDSVPSLEWEQQASHLIGNLEKQCECYGRYRELTAQQRLALIRNNLAENQQVNEAADALCDELTHLEQQRISLTNRILGRVEIPFSSRPPAPPAKCEDLYPMLSDEKADKLRMARQQLQTLIAELKKDLEVNAALAENARKIIHTTIVIMTSVVERPDEKRMAVYGKQGMVRSSQSQVRSLYSRTV